MHPIVDAFWKGREKLKIKIVGKYFDHAKKPKGACHLGAVYFGLYNSTLFTYQALEIDYPRMSAIVDLPCLPCPSAAGEMEGEIGTILIHLNDYHDARTWPTKRVAEWLETVLK